MKHQWLPPASLSIQLILATGGLIISITFLLGAVAIFVVQKQSEQNLQVRVGDAEAALRGALVERIDRSSDLANWVAENPAVVRALIAQDTLSESDLRAWLRGAPPDTVIWVKDSRGKTIVRNTELELSDGDLLPSSVPEPQLRGEFSASPDCGLWATASATVRGGDRLLGTSSVGVRLVRGIIDSIKEETGADAWFLCGSLDVPIVVGARNLELDAATSEEVFHRGRRVEGPGRVDGTFGYGAYAPFLDSAGNIIGMYGVFLPASEITGARDNAIRVFGVLASVLATLVLAETVIVSRHITAPLISLTRATHEFSEGRLVPSLAIKGNDEIAALARSFEEMQRKLQDSHIVLEQERDRYRDFLAIIPHELQTPLAAVIASVELLEASENRLGQEEREMLSTIRRSVNRLQSLMSNLLDAVSLEAGQLRIQPTVCRLDEIIDEARAFSLPLLTKRRQTLNIRIPSDVQCVEADPRRIAQVLVNLLTNASKYGRSDDSISLDVDPCPGGVRVAVTDHGAGIPIEDQTNLFRRFVRVGAGRDGSIAGIGFGLSLVKEIVERHGGKVGVDSAPGRGTCVWFTLSTLPVAVLPGLTSP